MIDAMEAVDAGRGRDAIDVLIAPNEEGWLKNREAGIGSSEAAALYDAFPETWKNRLTPLGLYARKKGLEPPQEPSYAMQRGLLMEPVFAKLAEARLGVPVFGPPPWTTFKLNGSRMMASVDRFTRDPDGIRILEFKKVGARSVEEWEDDDGQPMVPLHYRIQVQGQMHVLGLEQARIFAELGDDEPTVFELKREPKFGAELQARIDAMWKLIESGTPPKAQGSQYDAVKLVWPKQVPGKSIDLVKLGKQDLLARWDGARRAKKIAEGEIEELQTLIGQLMGDAELAYVGARRISFKQQTRTTQPHPVIPEALAVARNLRAGSVSVDEREAILDALIAELVEAAKPDVWIGRVMLPPKLKD